MKLPEIGSKWKHSNGIVYKVLWIANEHSQRPDYPITVIYQGLNKKVWSKPLDNFLDRMEELK